MTYQEFKKNFSPEFLKIKSFAGKIKYASQYLTRIGLGTGRIVYDIDGEKILKLARNPKGVAQNETEAGAGYYHDTQHIVTIVFDSADDDSWIISEKAKKVNEARIKQLTGIPSLNDVYCYLRNFHDTNNGKRANFHQEPDVIEQLNNNEFVQDLQNFIADYAQSPGDFGRPSTYGEVLHDGQPSIVLTDYGLNDEVYDTHYAPKLNNQGYRIHELYNFADGNDDILGDMPPQDGVDTRQGMWALMPYSVGDGPGVINEEFLSFVENQGKYPEGITLPSTPYILDEFHDIVNNLKEVLDHVKDKKKFYGKLLELQDYLIRGKFYDREPLEEETVQLHEANTPAVKPMSLKKDYSNTVAESIAQKLNLGTAEFLGSGGYGFAYTINNNRVLKITTDVCEVDAGLKIQRAKPQALVAVYSIYKVIDRENNITTYALIEDHIANKPIDEFFEYISTMNEISIVNELKPNSNLYGNLLIALRKRKLDEYLELSQKILTENPTANINKADREKAHQFMMGLLEIKKELMQLQIKSDDYSNLENVGYKNGILTYFDIGGCFNIMKEPELPPENRIDLPEGMEAIDEAISKENADKVADVVAQKFGYSQPKYIDKGVFGVAYDIGNNMILKVTSDKSEANENLELIGKPLKYIAQPYKVFSIKSQSVKTTTGEDNVYVIILEKLRTDPGKFIAMKQRMDFAFKKIMNIDYPDVVDYYVNGYSPGLDVDEEMVKKYFARNPEDAKFFADVVKIGKEAKSYGLESMDYVNPTNLGYKPDGSLGFFDVGFGNYFFNSENKPEEVQVDEDGSAKFSTDNSYGQDNFPTYDNTGDDSPLTDNNVPTTVDEDLEYHNVVGDATQDKYELDERIKSFQPGSQSVEVKKKCRLAGNGNTSTACNQGDINNLNIKPIMEEIDAKEVYGDENYNKSLKSVINGKRDVCFIEMNQVNVNLVEKNKLRVIPTRMTSQNTMMAIVYRDSIRAHKLYDIAKSRDGYLNDKSAEEAREIGQLLGYKEASIEEYIRRKYGNKIPVMPDRSPDDFDDLAEGKFDNYGKDIEQDNTTHQLNKKLIRTYNDGIDVNPIYAVNGDEVRDSGFIEWVEGGNHWVDADLPEDEQKYAKHIPPDELWVDDVHLSKPNDFEAILLHERTESYLIKHYGYTYDDAHDIANKVELIFREKTHNISDEEESENISSLMFTAFKKNFKSKTGKKFQDEGVADVAAEKQFNIEPPHQGFEDKFARDQQEDVVYTDPNSDLVIIRNPKRLDSIFGSTRGVIDPEGNLYIEQRSNGIHYDMLYALNKLGLVEDEADWDSKLPTNFVTVQRYLKTNKILLGESNFAMKPEEERPEGSTIWQNIPNYEEAEPIYQRFLDRAKQKTPIFEFINERLDEYKRKIEAGAANELFEDKSTTQCQEVQLTPEIREYLQKFGSDEELLRSGGIPTDMLDRAAFGFDDSLKELMPNQLSIKWNDDLENVKWEVKKKGLTDVDYAKKINLAEPIDVSFDGKNFNIEDGHHRYYAASVLNLPLKINLEIKANPVTTLSQGMGYDDFHRCIWKQAHGQTNEMLNEEKLTESKIRVPDYDHTGWITPDNKFVESNVHLAYLVRLYPNIKKQSEIYDKAYSDGYTRIIFNKGEIGNILDIHAPTEERLKEILLDAYSSSLGGESYIYTDIGDEEHSKHQNFTLPTDKEELNNFLYSNKRVRNIMYESIMSLQDLPFKQEVEQAGGKIYSVGGAPRDELLGKESKDLDLLISGIPIEELKNILQKYGRASIEGESFAVIIFTPKGSTESIDIAVPRTEKPTGGGGHKDFKVTADHTLPIEKDLERRDFTINAIAKDINGNIIDPYGGQEDMKDKIIRAVNPQAFSDDPLRMLRAVQFASRFGFTIEPKTTQMIINSAQMIKKEPAERLLKEFGKIVGKGNPRIGAQLLKDTGLYSQIFDTDLKQSTIDKSPFEEVKTIGEYVYLLIRLFSNPAEYYLQRFATEDAKRDKIYKEIIALDMAYDNATETNPVKTRSVVHNMYVTFPQSLQSQILPSTIKIVAQELLQGKYPKTVNELAVNGNDLADLGLKGKEIGDMQKSLLLKVYADKVRNSKEDLLVLSKQNDTMIKEELSEKVEYGTLLLFLNMPRWEKITSIILPEDIYDVPEYGIEKEPHVTVLYGFTDEVTAEDVFGLVKETISMKPINVGITGISVFRNSDFDVIKFDVDSPELVKLHDVVKQLPNKESFPDYHPHITIAYTKPGMGKKYIHPFEKERSIKGSELIFSTKGHKGKEGETLALEETYAYNTLEPKKSTWNVNGQQVDINFFTDQYYQWNQGIYDYTSTKSVLEFLDNNYPDLMNDERLKHDLYYKLADREILDEEQKQMKSVRYTAVVLDDKSRTALLKRLGNMIPEGWETIAHHATINLGPIAPEFAKFLGIDIDLNVEDFAMDNKVMAVGVAGMPTKNAKPHITLAVNRANGGKPMMSNQLTNWEKLSEPLILTGKVTEVE